MEWIFIAEEINRISCIFELIQFFASNVAKESLLLLNSIEEIRYVRLTNNR